LKNLSVLPNGIRLLGLSRSRSGATNFWILYART